MWRSWILKLIFSISMVFLPLFQISAQDYTYKQGDPNGIGKWYMGREIAYVMGYQGMRWLERPERESEENTSSLIEFMQIEQDDIIADIGAGSGYHVFRMAPLSPSGLIYAVDIQEQMLRAIATRNEKEKFDNIEPIKGTEKAVNLPLKSVDKVLMVDVYHEFSYPKEMITSIVQAMKDDAKLYLIEYRGEDPTVPIKKVHKMTVKQAVKEMDAVGLKLERNIKKLPWQHCMIFVKK